MVAELPYDCIGYQQQMITDSGIPATCIAWPCIALHDHGALHDACRLWYPSQVKQSATQSNQELASPASLVMCQSSAQQPVRVAAVINVTVSISCCTACCVPPPKATDLAHAAQHECIVSAFKAPTLSTSFVHSMHEAAPLLPHKHPRPRPAQPQQR